EEVIMDGVDDDMIGERIDTAKVKVTAALEDEEDMRNRQSELVLVLMCDFREQFLSCWLYPLYKSAHVSFFQYTTYIFIFLLEKKKEIRNCILAGEIDEAIALTESLYPGVLEDKDLIYFRLRCRRFIEMMGACSRAEPRRQRQVATARRVTNANGKG